MKPEVFLKLSDKAPLYRQIYAQIREAILSGRLRPGDKLPATRDLSERFEVARNVVILAYERLATEGYIETRAGSGTYVTPHFSAYVGTEREENHRGGEAIALARWLRNLDRWAYTPSLPALTYDFRPGRPALEHFPAAVWRRIMSRHLRHLSPDLARYGGPEGYQPLREAIAAYLGRSRAVVCHPDQVVITAGAQQALDLLARLLLSPGQRVALENPSYPAAVAVFRAALAELYPVPVDDQGIQTSRLPRGVRLLYITPSHQYPTGVLLSLSRRLELLNWARKYQTVILEDDYDSEFRYGGGQVESLQGLDRSGLVIYLGTFSKVLFPKLRVGYVVLPPALVKPFLSLKWISDRHSAGLTQRFLADFMNEGYFESYLRKMRKVYRERRLVLLESLAEYSQDYIDVAPSIAGLHLAGLLKRRVNMTLLKNRAAEGGVGVYPLAPYFLERPRAGLVFGFAGISADEIRTGIRLLGQVLASLVFETRISQEHSG